MGLSLVFCMWIPGARLLRQSESVASATVSGSPGSTGQAQVAFSSPQGSFSQTIPISGSGGVQFSSANGGTLTIPGADGVPQTFTSVLGPVGAPLPPPLVPSVPLPTVESITRNLPSVALPGSDDDLAAQVRARIKAFFAEYYRSFKPPQQTGVVVARQAGTVAVQSPTVAPRAVAAAPRAVAAAPQTPVVVQQTSGSDPRVQRVSFHPSQHYAGKSFTPYTIFYSPLAE